jgi:hypothetical protein
MAGQVLVGSRHRRLQPSLPAVTMRLSWMGISALAPVLETNIMDTAPVRMKPAIQPTSERNEKARLRPERNREKKAVAAGGPTGSGRPPN